MPRAFRFPPYPRKPHPSGQGRIKIAGHQHYLGPWHDQPRCRAEYARLLQEAAGRAAAGLPQPARPGLTVHELWAQFLAHAQLEKPAKEYAHYRRLATAACRAAGEQLRAAEFGVSDLDRLREALVSGSLWTPEERAKRYGPWCRNVVNVSMTRVRQVWAWAERKDLLPKGAAGHLKTLAPLSRANRSVRQTKPRQGVDWPAVEAILPHLPAAVAAMVQGQYWAGLRPSEAVRVRVCDLEDWGDVWAYRVRQPKGSWRDGAADAEYAALGPECWAAWEPWYRAAVRRGPEAPMFATGRPSSGRHYTTDAYARAIKRAFEANPKLAAFTAYQLRHGAKRRIMRAAGLDAARAVLRQASVAVTDKYDRQRDLETARAIAGRLG